MARRRTVTRPRPSAPVRKVRRAAEPRSSAATPAPAVTAVVPGSIPPGAEGVARPRVERPHSQAVCRTCGRIVEVGLMLNELKELSALTARAPSGWRVDGISFTLMGQCRRCKDLPPRRAA